MAFRVTSPRQLEKAGARRWPHPPRRPAAAAAGRCGAAGAGQPRRSRPGRPPCRSVMVRRPLRYRRTGSPSAGRPGSPAGPVRPAGRWPGARREGSEAGSARRSALQQSDRLGWPVRVQPLSGKQRTHRPARGARHRDDPVIFLGQQVLQHPAVKAVWLPPACQANRDTSGSGVNCTSESRALWSRCGVGTPRARR